MPLQFSKKLPMISSFWVVIIGLALLTACSSDSPPALVPTATVTTTVAPSPTATVSYVVTAMPTFTPTPPYVPTGKLSAWQQRWLKQTPCAPPCFEGIIPGKTTADEAITLMQQNQLVTKVVKLPREKRGGVGWYWADTSNSSGPPTGVAEYRMSDKIVEYVIASYQEKFTLTEIITTFGEPSNIIAQAATLTEDTRKTRYNVTFIYLKQGFALDYALIDQVPELSPSMRLELLTLFAPGLQPFKLDTMQEWQGFKGFSFYCRPPKGSSEDSC